MKFTARDNEACDKEVLVRSSKIQSHVSLILIDPDTRALVARSEDSNLGHARLIDDLFHKGDLREIETELESGIIPLNRNLRLLSGEDVWCEFFRSETLIGCEISTVNQDTELYQRTAEGYARSLRLLNRRAELAEKGAESALQDYLNCAVEQIQLNSGFDRAMIYRFDSDWNGEIIAEAGTPFLQHSFKGLKFPSGDIPKPARDLFLRNPIRIIADVDAEQSEVLGCSDTSEQPFEFDCTQANARHVSPVHAQYLSNMKVRATMVFGLVVGRRLWGLISCHHYQGPLILSPIQQTMVTALSDTITSHLTSILQSQSLSARRRIERFNTILMQDVRDTASGADFLALLQDRERQLLRMLHANTIVLRLENEEFVLGENVEPNLTRTLEADTREWMRHHRTHSLVTTDFKGVLCSPDLTMSRFNGLAAFSSADQSHRIYVLRNERPTLHTWAGDPDGKYLRLVGENGDTHLNPRTSFEAHEALTKHTSEKWEDDTTVQIEELLNGVSQAYLTFKQIRAEILLKRELETSTYLALHDQLTGLPNRRSFEAEIARRQASMNREDRTVWLLHIDLDHFKQINDNFGHDVGDQALKHISSILRAELPPDDHAARIGGDEFAFLISHFQDEDLLEKFCEHLLAQFSRPFMVKGHEYSLTCSIGIARLDETTADMTSALKRSDVALYEAKKQKQGAFVFCTPALEIKAIGRRQLENEIEIALADGQFVPFFQPQVQSDSGDVSGLEVLVRWEHPSRGLLLPSDFLNVAQKANLLDFIDQNIFDQALSIRGGWQSEEGMSPKLSFNIGESRLKSRALRADLAKLGDDSQSITLELLETIYFEDPDADHKGEIEDLKSHGVSIAIDDFGSGRSSLLAITALQPDVLKIDRRLIQPVSNSDAAQNLIVSIKSIADKLGIKTVAEGVESSDQVEIIKKIGCDTLQGFHIARPMSAAASLDYLLKSQAA